MLTTNTAEADDGKIITGLLWTLLRPYDSVTHISYAGLVTFPETQAEILTGLHHQPVTWL